VDAAFGGFDVLDLAFKTAILPTCPSMRFCKVRISSF